MYKKGFTLIELSIVVVIIGLIVAGVVGGQKLVHQAQLKRIGIDFQKYQTAFNAFRLKYSAYPGDMTDASSYWSSCGGGSASACNGNGDKEIGIPDEDYVAWEHLS